MKSDTPNDKRVRAAAQGTVFRKGLGQYDVRCAGGPVACSLSSKLRKELVYPEPDPSSRRRRVVDVKRIEAVDPVAIGDTVSFVDSGDGTGMITAVLPRRNQFSRTAPKPPPREQVIVANADQLVVVFAAAQPRQKWGMRDRHLVTAEAATGLFLASREEGRVFEGCPYKEHTLRAPDHWRPTATTSRGPYIRLAWMEKTLGELTTI